jgi:hypothetical protein
MQSQGRPVCPQGCAADCLCVGFMGFMGFIFIWVWVLWVLYGYGFFMGVGFICVWVLHGCGFYMGMGFMGFRHFYGFYTLTCVGLSGRNRRLKAVTRCTVCQLLASFLPLLSRVLWYLCMCVCVYVCMCVWCKMYDE